jgi:hypothetical protein
MDELAWSVPFMPSECQNIRPNVFYYVHSALIDATSIMPCELKEQPVV